MEAQSDTWQLRAWKQMQNKNTEKQTATDNQLDRQPSSLWGRGWEWKDDRRREEKTSCFLENQKGPNCSIKNLATSLGLKSIEWFSIET